MKTEISDENILNVESMEVLPKPSALSLRLSTVTPLSKYLAMVVFIVLPFLGFWLGAQWAESSLHDEVYIESKTENTEQFVPESSAVSPVQVPDSNAEDATTTDNSLPKGFIEVYPGTIPNSAPATAPVTKNQSLGEVCPDELIRNSEPCAYDVSPDECNVPARDYYIYQGVRHELSEFNSAWVDVNCKLTVSEVW
ncbi:MAG: hypothetical protein RLZZ230_100 [Candidatus Parcubacteria bacterium]|jgi:hypothetical protein